MRETRIDHVFTVAAGPRSLPFNLRYQGFSIPEPALLDFPSRVLSWIR